MKKKTFLAQAGIIVIAVTTVTLTSVIGRSPISQIRPLLFSDIQALTTDENDSEKGRSLDTSRVCPVSYVEDGVKKYRNEVVYITYCIGDVKEGCVSKDCEPITF